MKYIYGDYPTEKEILFTQPSLEKINPYWEQIQKERKGKAELITLKSKGAKEFSFVITSHLIQLIGEISAQRGFLEALSLPAPFRKKFQEKALNYEAYYSSHIEGARSSLEEALRFMKKKQKYSSDESLQMIQNNRHALDYAIKQMDKTITHELICKLQFILTENTHRERPITRGEYRHGPVYIVNGLGQVIYEGPAFEKVPKMMEEFIQWINHNDSMNPLIKAGITHLYFVHVHPFDDGNGRTARAFSNLVLANQGFQFINLLSLSSYFDHQRPAYYKAIQDVRAHNDDLTYFLIFFMEALLSKLKDLRKEIEFESKLKNLKNLIVPEIYQKLQRRHVKALRYMLKNNETITTQKYCKLNQCSDETARKDFLDLMKFKLIRSSGQGRSRAYQLIIPNPPEK